MVDAHNHVKSSQPFWQDLEILFCSASDNFALAFMHACVRVLCEVAGSRVHSTKCKPAANLPREKAQAILECPSEAAMTPTALQFQA